MPIATKITVFGGSALSQMHRFVGAVVAITIIAGLFAFGIALPDATSEDRIQAQSGNSACAEPPVEPDDVELWEHDGGILVQWDPCRDHSYEIRWRLRSAPVDDPFHWPNTTTAGRDGLFDIPFDTPNTDNTDYLDPDDVEPLRNGQRYIVQLRPIHVEDNRIDRGSWTDDYFATPRRCGDLPETPDSNSIRVLGGDSKLTVSWDRCSGTRSHIRWRTVVDRVAGQWSNYVDVGDRTTYEIGDLENGVDYDVQIRTALSSSSRLTNEDGNTYRSEWSDPVSGAPTSVCPEGEPVVPEEFVVLPGDAKLYVSWRPCPEHRYQLRHKERSETDFSSWRNVEIDSHTIRGLTNRTRYEVQVRSIRDGDNSAATGSYVATPLRPPDNNRSPGWKDVPRRLSLVENRNYDDPIATIEAADPDRNVCRSRSMRPMVRQVAVPIL